MYFTGYKILFKWLICPPVNLWRHMQIIYMVKWWLSRQQWNSLDNTYLTKQHVFLFHLCLLSTTIFIFLILFLILGKCIVQKQIQYLSSNLIIGFFISICFVWLIYKKIIFNFISSRFFYFWNLIVENKSMQLSSWFFIFQISFLIFWLVFFIYKIIY